jgi:long-chain fatty acid transport protein
MRSVSQCVRGLVWGSIVAAGLAAAGSAADAGGIAVREQSASSQGASFAGSAAGYDLSSMFWNPAAAGIAGWGWTTESHLALIIANGELSGTATINPAVGPPFGGTPVPGATSTDFDGLALVPSSYAAYRFNRDLVLGLSINSPFGLTTKPDNIDWVGRSVGRTAKVFTVNAAPTLSYQIAPGLFIGAGVQLEYMKVLFKFASAPGLGAISPPPGSPNAYVDIDDNLGVGFTAGVLWAPSPATHVGLGFRSSVKHDLDGKIFNPSTGSAAASAELELPEMVTLSIRQAVAPNVRLLGTVEWTNWSRFDRIPVQQALIVSPFAPGGLALDLHWHDGWFFSGGIEVDVSRQLTVRGGLAFEKSPIQNATERLIQVPDSDRIWASVGLTYRLSPNMAMDLAYSHVWFDDAPFDRSNLINTVRLIGEADQSADIIAASLKIRWGGPREPLK